MSRNASLFLVILLCVAGVLKGQSPVHKYSFEIRGLKCGACAFRIKQTLKEKYSLGQPKDVTLDFKAPPIAHLSVRANPETLKPDDIKSYLEKKTGFKVTLLKNIPLSD